MQSSDIRSPQAASETGTRVRKLFVHQRYFGLGAQALHDGADRTVKRASGPGNETRINARTLSEDFRLDAAAGGTLLRAFLMEGVLYPDGNGGYHITERLREYALARVIEPLPRARAKALIRSACEIAVVVNRDVEGSPLMVDTIAVSGSYMSRWNLLTDLCLWLVLRRRSRQAARHGKPSLGTNEAVHQIRAAMKELSPFIVVRVVQDKQDMERPFTVVFQAKEELVDPSLPAWEKLRDWRALIGRHAAPAPKAGVSYEVPLELVTQQRGPRTLQRAKGAWGTVPKRG